MSESINILRTQAIIEEVGFRDIDHHRVVTKSLTILASVNI